MAKTQRQEDEPTRSRRVRAALLPAGRVSAAATACILWTGLTLPGLQLVPGLGGFGDQSISISLQSALLGIDDGGREPTAAARAAMRALGLTAIRTSARPPLRSATGDGVSLAVQVAETVRADTAAATPASNPTHPRPQAGSETAGSGDVEPDRTTPRRPPVDPAEPAPTPGGGGGTGGGTPSTPPPVPAKSVQSITFTTSPSTAVVGGSYSVGASASSGLPVSFSVAPASAGVCTVSGTTVAFVGTGTCTVRANQAGNESYLPAPEVTQSFAVVAAIGVQTISFTSTPPSGAYVGGPTYTVAATASSGLAVIFSSGSPSVCSVSGSTVSFTGAGTCIVRANQPGNGSYEPAPQVQQSFTVVPTPSPQTITFTSTAPTNAVYLGPSYDVTATATSGLPVTFTVSGTCTLSGSTVSMAGAGTCTVYADQSGSSAFLAAPQVQQTFSIAKRAQTISFPNPGPLDKDWPPVTLSATASSGLPVTYTLDPSSAGVCSLSGSTLTPIDRGDCRVSANQPGDANYLAAPQVTIEIKIRHHVPG